MTDVYTYQDIIPYADALRTRTNPQNNLCTKYFPDKNQFCGNYVCRRVNYCDNSDRRCWQHVKRKQIGLPVVVLLMVTSEGKIYNKRIWLKFLEECDKYEIPIELVIYDVNMFNTTVRHKWNFISRFRPSPLKYKKPLIDLHNQHGSINYTNVFIQMLEYGSEIEGSRCCIVITERTIPIRSPKSIYRSAIQYRNKCFVDTAFGVQFTDDPPETIPIRRGGKLMEVVNNKAQSLYSSAFLKVALPTLKKHASIFGLVYDCQQNLYKIKDEALLRKWCEYTGAKPDEFWLFNSYLIDLYFRGEEHPIRHFSNHYLSKTPIRDHSIVCDVPVWLDHVKRSIVFTDSNTKKSVATIDAAVTQYFKELRHTAQGRSGIMMHVSLKDIIIYLRSHKTNALFFRSVQIE